MKGRVPPTGSAKEGYHFLPAGWWGEDSQERSTTLLLQTGVENRYLPTGFCHSIHGGGGAMWLCHGVHLENADALKGFYLAQLPFPQDFA